MKHEPDISSRAPRQPTQADIAEAKAAYAVEGDVDHVVVGAWLLTWGTPQFKDFPGWLAEQDG